MVVDAGGFKGGGLDTRDMIVAPYLRRLGIKKIDILAGSHPEQDHIGGIPALLEQFEVGELWRNDDRNPGLGAFSKTLEIARREGIPVRIWKNSGEIRMGDAVKIAVFPCINCRGASRNDRSLVLRVSFQDKALLLPADIGISRESELVRHFDIASDALVVPHHGSRTSSSLSFLRSVNPRAAVCSVGFGNQFDLPSKKVLTTYSMLGIPVLRTDQVGTVDILLQPGRALEIHTFKSLGKPGSHR